MRDTSAPGPETGRWSKLFLLIAILFGAIVRLAPPMLAGFPVNDGGMFAAMIDDLRHSGLLLPSFTSYNNLSIPFAYPPLSLYAGALLSAAGVPTIEIVRWLPAMISAAGIPAFHWMAKQMLATSSKAALAALLYALMPRSFSWYVMGGGLSRSFGILFLLLTCGSAWLAFTRPSARRTLVTALLGAGAVLSHPETALHAAAACALIWLFHGHSRRGVRDGLLITLGVLLLTSPWWGSVVARHGLAPFASALQTGGHGGFFLLPWLTFDFSQEPFVAVLAALGMGGLLLQVARRAWFIPVWTLVPFVVEPRSAPAIAILPLAMLAEEGLSGLVLPQLGHLFKLQAPTANDWSAVIAASRCARLIMAAIITYALFGAFAYDLSLAQVVVSPASRAAMQWVKQNTSPTARFAVLTGASDAFADPVAEWFPALTGRSSINTLQGQEWTLAARFMPSIDKMNGLQRCFGLGTACLSDYPADYYLVQFGQADDGGQSVPLILQLQEDPAYKSVYESNGIIIFQRK